MTASTYVILGFIVFFGALILISLDSNKTHCSNRTINVPSHPRPLPKIPDSVKIKPSINDKDSLPNDFIVYLELKSGLKKRFEGYQSIYVRDNTLYFSYGMSEIPIDIDEIKKMKFKRY